MVAIDTLRVGVFGSDFSFPGQGKRSGGAVIAARGRRRDDLPSVIALLASARSRFLVRTRRGARTGGASLVVVAPLRAGVHRRGAGEPGG